LVGTHTFGLPTKESATGYFCAGTVILSHDRGQAGSLLVTTVRHASLSFSDLMQGGGFVPSSPPASWSALGSGRRPVQGQAAPDHPRVLFLLATEALKKEKRGSWTGSRMSVWDCGNSKQRPVRTAASPNSGYGRAPAEADGPSPDVLTNSKGLTDWVGHGRRRKIRAITPPHVSPVLRTCIHRRVTIYNEHSCTAQFV
jgi:hypothetical protein